MIARVWERLFWADESAYNLAAVRIVIASHALWVLLSRDLPGLSALPPQFWAGVESTTRLRYGLFPGLLAMETVLQWIAVVALFAVLVGWRVKPAAWISALTLYHLAPLEAIIWTAEPFERGFEVTVLALVVLAVTPCDRVWSVVAAKREEKSPPASPDYRWGLVLVQLFVAQIYLFSGYSKLFRAGFDWISAENMTRWLLLFAQQDQVASSVYLGPWISERPLLAWAAAAAAVAVDLGFISVLFWPRLRRFFLPTVLAFHAGILYGMGIFFLNAPQLLVFLNWDWIRSRLVHRRVAPVVSLGTQV